MRKNPYDSVEGVIPLKENEGEELKLLQKKSTKIEKPFEKAM